MISGPEAIRLLASACGLISIADSSVSGAGARAFAGPRTHSLFFIFAQATELALKAFLIKKGMSLADLAKPRPYGHNLRRLLDEARSNHGLRAPELPPAYFDPWNDLYRLDKRLQYFASDGGPLPPIKATREMVHGFIIEAAEEPPQNRSDLGVTIDFGADYPGVSLDEAWELERAGKLRLR